MYPLKERYLIDEIFRVVANINRGHEKFIRLPCVLRPIIHFEYTAELIVKTKFIHYLRGETYSFVKTERKTLFSLFIYSLFYTHLLQ